MISEFFKHKSQRTRSLAYGGLLIFLAHALFKAYLKARLNSWYGNFYEVAGSASAEPGSGELPSKRKEVSFLLWQFAAIVMPAVVVNPVARWALSVWQYSWRIALVRAYLRGWDTDAVPIEGAAQRIHEDTKRFEEGISGCISKFLDAVCTLLVFTPLLIDLGARVRPPGTDWPPWLFCVAFSSAVGGLLISVVVGRQLVHLEVQNQRVEAELRTDLVMLAESPANVCRSGPRDGQVDNDGFVDINPREPAQAVVSAATAFREVLGRLWVNYRRLYAQFAIMNTWLSSFDQFNAILPYLLAAPLLFAPDDEHRITLGLLVKIANAFSRVFDSLTVLSENWAEVNAFRAVVRRLREFEIVLYRKRLVASTAVHSHVELNRVS